VATERINTHASDCTYSSISKYQENALLMNQAVTYVKKPFSKVAMVKTWIDKEDKAMQ
jgi:hypothetical protein